VFHKLALALLFFADDCSAMVSTIVSQLQTGRLATKTRFRTFVVIIIIAGSVFWLQEITFISLFLAYIFTASSAITADSAYFHLRLREHS